MIESPVAVTYLDLDGADPVDAELHIVVDAAVSLELRSGDGVLLGVAEGYDGEAALLELRDQLDAAGIRLLVNRFRRDAFVSSMARQMTGGFGCYLVEPQVPVDPERIVESLAAAPPELVVDASEHQEAIDAWIAGFSD